MGKGDSARGCLQGAVQDANRSIGILYPKINQSLALLCRQKNALIMRGTHVSF